ncbi:MAG: nucleoside kinase [Bacteroidales bacterium]|nr:nucleoside kinase [Candidatus Sodaliphilus limicaballi]
MDNDLKIFCTNTGEYVDVEGGETLQHVYERIKDRIGFSPISVLVNNRDKHITYPLYGPKQVEFLDRNSTSGRRAYIRSLCMVLYKATVDLFPGKRLIVQHSIGKGYFCTFKHNHTAVEGTTVKAIKTRMKEIIAEDTPFVRRERPTKELIELFDQRGMNDKVRFLAHSTALYTVYYELGDIIDTFHGPLAPSTGHLSTFDLIPYKEGMLLLGPDPDNPAVPAKAGKHEKIYNAFLEGKTFNAINNVSDMSELNCAILNKQATQIIDVAETLHSQMLSNIASEIARRFKKGGARMVLIAGPSASGKTTTTRRLATHLKTKFLKPKMISLDNYVVNRVDTPLDENGEWDFENIKAVDLELFNRDMADLLAGKEVKMPTFNFETGCREYRGDTMRLEPDDVVLLEGLHCLNPELTKFIPEEMKFRIYISVLTTLNIDDHNWISTSDCRLLRRIMRDHKSRGFSAQETIERWPSVRKGEEKWIFPFQENADAIFNSSIICELAVMKNYALPILEQVPPNVAEHSEAHRLLTFLKGFYPIDGREVPRTSLLREYLG